MSYCVNCGVELADSEKRCPLCDTEVLNPRRPWREPTERPYPQSVETIISRIDRRYVASLMTTILCIPVLVTMLCDFLPDGRLTWSTFVVGAGAMIFVWVILPLFSRRFHLLTFIAADGAAIILYLLLIEQITGGGWFLRLGFPIVLALTLMLMVLIFFARRRTGRRGLIRAAMALITVGIYSIAVEILTDVFVFGFFFLNWSPYVLIPCLVLSAAFYILDHRQKLKEEIKKRLFY